MIHTVTDGNGPPVVFVAALGFPGSSWRPVVTALRAGSATLTYDRPACGASPPRADLKTPITFGSLADELEALLIEIGVTAPAVVAGHSVGGNIARVFASRYPRRVAGLVFVDCSLPALLVGDERGPIIDGDDEVGNEIDLATSEEEVLAAGVPPVPAIVLARTPGRGGIDEIWAPHQRGLAAIYGAPLLIADDSGHHLTREAPDLVAFATDTVVQAVRDGARPSIDPAALAAAKGHRA